MLITVKTQYKLTRSMVNNTEFLVLPHQHHWFLLHIFNFSEVEKRAGQVNPRKGWQKIFIIWGKTKGYKAIFKTSKLTNPNSKQTVGVLNIISPTSKWILDDFIYLLTRLIETLMMVTKTFFDIDRAVYLEINDSGKNIHNRNMAFEYDYAKAWHEQ